MSVIICKHCSKYIDTDFDSDHEYVCAEPEDVKINPFKKVRKFIHDWICFFKSISPCCEVQVIDWDHKKTYCSKCQKRLYR